MKKKIYFSLLSLITILCSCNAKTNNSDSLQVSNGNRENTSSEIIPIVEGYEQQEMILGNAPIPDIQEWNEWDNVGDGGSLFIEQFSTINQIYQTMTYDEEKQLKIPSLSTQRIYIDSTNGKLLKIKENENGTINFSENSYFASCGSDDLTSDFIGCDGIVYAYVSCNQPISLLTKSCIVKTYPIDNVWNEGNYKKYEIFYEIKETEIGYSIHSQCQFNEENNQYTIGTILLNRKIDLNSKTIQEINKNSSLPIPLGCLSENITNLDQLDCSIRLNININLKYHDYKYYFGHFIEGFFIEIEDLDLSSLVDTQPDKYYASRITLDSNNPEEHILGVHCKMNKQEAIDQLLSLGFKIKHQENSTILTKENVVIVIGGEDSNLVIQVYIDLIDKLAEYYGYMFC